MLKKIIWLLPLGLTLGMLAWPVSAQQIDRPEPPCDPDPESCDDGGWGGSGGSTPAVGFIHGLNGNSSSWPFGLSYVASQTSINGSLINYASNTSITNIATTVSDEIASKDFIVAHSMGGLVTREAIRRGIDGNLEALITVGTPHLGAPLADNPGQLVTTILDFGFDILQPLELTLSYLTDWNQSDVDAVEADIVAITAFAQPLVDFLFTGEPPESDLKTTSSFLSTLNSNPTSTIAPVASTFFIYGDEDAMTHWRTMQTSALGEVEDGNWAGFFEDIADVYNFAAVIAGGAAFTSIISCVENYDPTVCESILELFAIAVSFYIAEQDIRVHHQAEFSSIVHASPPGEEDGIVPIWSQSPTSIFSTVPGENFMIAEGVNHLEERDHVAALNRVVDAINSAKAQN